MTSGTGRGKCEWLSFTKLKFKNSNKNKIQNVLTFFEDCLSYLLRNMKNQVPAELIRCFRDFAHYQIGQGFDNVEMLLLHHIQ